MTEAKVALTPAQRFHTNLLDLCDLLGTTIGWVNEQGVSTNLSPLMATGVRFYVATWQPDKAIEGFISKSANYWDEIHKRNKQFLVENADVLFAELSDYKAQIQAMSNLFAMKRTVNVSQPDGTTRTVEQYVIPDETLDSIWDILHSMVRISIRHIHERRKPVLVEVEADETVDGKPKKVTKKVPRYSVEYFPEISIKKNVQLWEVKM